MTFDDNYAGGLEGFDATEWGERGLLESVEVGATALEGEDQQKLGRALAFMLDWFFQPAHGAGKPEKRLELVGRRVLAARWVSGSEQFDGDPSLTRVGMEFGIHKAVMSELTAEFSRLSGIRNQHQMHGGNWAPEARQPARRKPMETEIQTPKKKRCGVKPMTLTESRRLGVLGSLVRGSWSAIKDGEDKATNILTGTVPEGVLLGGYLIEVKGLVGHGGWENWLRDSAKINGYPNGMHQTYANRLMRLHKAIQDGRLDLDKSQPKSLNEAFQMAGILHSGGNDSVAPSPELRGELNRAARLDVGEVLDGGTAIEMRGADAELGRVSGGTMLHVEQPGNGATLGGDGVEARAIGCSAAVEEFSAVVREAWGRLNWDRLSSEERGAARLVLESLLT